MAQLANIVKNGKLVSEAEWKRYISGLEKITKKSNKKKLTETIINSVKKRIPKKRFGIMFSGGVDSSLIAFLCKKLKANFICYSAGIEGSEDLEYAERIAKKYGFKLRSRVYILDEVEEIVKNVAKIMKKIKKYDPVTIGVASVEYAAAMLARKDKVNTFFGGLGSEEIFAGYERHLLAKDKHKECWNGLKNMWGRDLLRDYTLAKELKFTALTPFLDKEVIISAMGIDINRKINEKQKKIILREIAEELGLAKEFAWRKKKAAQYGSGFDKAIEKLARKNGFRFKNEWLRSL